MLTQSQLGFFHEINSLVFHDEEGRMIVDSRSYPTDTCIRYIERTAALFPDFLVFLTQMRIHCQPPDTPFFNQGKRLTSLWLNMLSHALSCEHPGLDALLVQTKELFVHGRDEALSVDPEINGNLEDIVLENTFTYAKDYAKKDPSYRVLLLGLDGKAERDFDLLESLYGRYLGENIQDLCRNQDATHLIRATALAKSQGTTWVSDYKEEFLTDVTEALLHPDSPRRICFIGEKVTMQECSERIGHLVGVACSDSHLYGKVARDKPEQLIEDAVCLLQRCPDYLKLGAGIDLYTAIVSTATMEFEQGDLLIGLMVELSRLGVDITHVCAALVNKSWGLGYLDEAGLDKFVKASISVIPDVMAGVSLREARFYKHCFITAVPESTLLGITLTDFELSQLHRLRGGSAFANQIKTAGGLEDLLGSELGL